MQKMVTATILAGLILVGREPGVREVEAGSRPTGGLADVVLEWNQLLQATIPSNASLARRGLHRQTLHDADVTVKRHGRHAEPPVRIDGPFESLLRQEGHCHVR